MGQQSEFEENCERYLLGELSEAEQEQFEEAYFTDDALFEQFQAVKDEMLDTYARGELAEEKKARFAEHFLASAANRRELDETQKFISAVTAVSAKIVATGDAAVSAPVAATTQKSTWRQSFKIFFNLRPFAWPAAFAAVLLVALAGTWIFVRNWRQATPADQAALQPTPLPTTPAPTSENKNTAIANDNAAVTPSPTPAGVNKPSSNVNQPAVNVKPTPSATPENPVNRPPPIAPAQIASAILMPVAVRDINASNTLRLNSGTRTVRLGLVFKSGDYRSYSAAITTIEGANVWRQNNLKAANKSVTLQFASALLRGQDYIVTLKGTTLKGQTETIGEYYFRVERSPN